MTKLFSILMIVLSLAFLAACGTSTMAPAATAPAAEGVQPQANGADQNGNQLLNQQFEALNNLTLDQREDFERQVKELAQKYDVRISDLEAQLPKLDESTQAQLNEQLNTLKQQRGDLQKQLDQLGTANDQNWQQLKSGIMTAIEDIEREVQEAEARNG